MGLGLSGQSTWVLGSGWSGSKSGKMGWVSLSRVGMGWVCGQDGEGSGRDGVGLPKQGRDGVGLWSGWGGSQVGMGWVSFDITL